MFRYLVYEFLLIIVNDNLVSLFEFIEEGKYIVIITFNPRKIRRVSEDKDISRIPRFSSSWISYDSFFELIHKYFMHSLKTCSMIYGYINQGDILSHLRYNNAIFIRSKSKIRTCSTAVSSICEESFRSVISAIDY